MSLGRDSFPMTCITPGVKLVTGSFYGNTSSNPPDSASKPQRGRGFTVVHTATGVFTVTITGKWLAFLHAAANIRLNTASAFFTVCRAVSDSAGTFTISIYDAHDHTADPALTDPGTSDVISFLAFMQDEGDIAHTA